MHLNVVFGYTLSYVPIFIILYFIFSLRISCQNYVIQKELTKYVFENINNCVDLAAKFVKKDHNL